VTGAHHHRMTTSDVPGPESARLGGRVERGH
jgi:hypothetical protein